MLKCLECGSNFAPKNEDQKFCKASCRVNNFQKKKRKEKSFDTGKKKKETPGEKHKNKPAVVVVGDSVSAMKLSDKHGAGKVVKEAIQNKEVSKPAVSNYLEQRRKAKLG